MWILLAAVVSILTASVRCRSCPAGYYPHNGVCSPCQRNCAECNWSDTCKWCKKGYYLLDNSCHPCPPDCESCSVLTKSICGTCQALGFYGTECSQRCSNGCKHRKCNKFDGHCRYGCLNGYYGNKCSRCPDVCITCSSSTSCTLCSTGFYGRMCDQRCHNCRTNRCSIDGLCTGGCIDGFYQATTGCTACPDRCSKCRSDSVCDECSPGYYGLTCHLKCPETCHTCTLDHRCVECNGSNAQQCEHNCSKTCFVLCSKTNDECLECVHGYYKRNGRCLPCRRGCAKCRDIDMCVECVDGHSPEPGTNRCHDVETKHRFDVFLNVVVPAAGLLVVIVLVTCIACMVVRYKNRSTSRGQPNQEALYITVLSDSTPSNTHAQVYSAEELTDMPTGPSQSGTITARLRNTDLSRTDMDREPNRIYDSIDETNSEAGAPCDQDQLPRTPNAKPPTALPERGSTYSMDTLDNQYESLQKDGASTNVYSSLS